MKPVHHLRSLLVACRRRAAHWRRHRLAERARRFGRGFSAAAALVGCGCAVYLCLRHSGELATVRWIPRRIGEWADHHGWLRNVPAFFLLTGPFLSLLPVRAWRAYAVAALATFAGVLELAEAFVPTRWVEWQDVAWSWAGILAAWVLYESLCLLVAWLTDHPATPQPSRP